MIDPARKPQIKELSALLDESERVLVFTGAGISTESGISDYRSQGGLWQRFQPVTIQEFLASDASRREYWQRKVELFAAMEQAAPNAGHRAVVDLERAGKLRGLITQNIDGLHGLAGSSAEKTLEIHGTNREIVCLNCGRITPWQEARDHFRDSDVPPECVACGGWLKPNTISFGQALDPRVLRESFLWAADCDLVLALGSTLVVEPAASIPRVAKEKGSRLVIITLSETPLDDLADLKIQAPVGESLPAAVAAMKTRHE